MAINKNKIKKYLREGVVTLAVIGLAAGALQYMARAGSLTPSTTPTSTMKNLSEIYDPIAGTYDSSAVVASSSGNVLQLLKCITEKQTGGNCP